MLQSRSDRRDSRRLLENGILDALGNLGDFIGGIAVVVTLLYLAPQSRRTR